jgi:Chaperone of endosialidase
MSRASTLTKLPIGLTGDASGNISTVGTFNGLTVGKGAGSVATNTAVGASALASNTSGVRNTAVGYQTLTANTTGTNTAMGYGSAATNTTGTYNAAFGYYSLVLNTTGSYNTSLGHESLYNNTTASNNTAVGYQAGYTNATGGRNTFLGAFAGYTSNVNGNAYNLAVGYEAGYSLTTGLNNTFVGGLDSGYYVTTGSKNTILGNYTGNQGGLDIRTASNYVVLSDGDGNPRGYFDGSGSFYINRIGNISVGYQCVTQAGGNNTALVVPSGSNALGFFISSSLVGSINCSGSSTTYNTSSDYRLKDVTGEVTGEEAKNFIMSLKPKQGTWKADGSRFVGFIAHEFQEVSPSSVTGEKDAVDENGEMLTQSMQSSSPEVMANLVAYIQYLETRLAALEAK